MNHKQCWDVIKKEYDGKYAILYARIDHATCFLDTKTIYVSTRARQKPTVDDLFALLHEIGHLETNDMEMCISMCEYLATQWAIEKMKTYKFDISDYEKKDWQKYIFQNRREDLKNGYDNVPPKNQLLLQW